MEILDYFYKGERALFVPANIYGKTNRDIRVIINRRVLSGNAKITVVFKRYGTHEWINSNTMVIENGNWDRWICGFAIPCNENFVIELQTFITSGEQCIIQIRDLLIEEIDN